MSPARKQGTVSASADAGLEGRRHEGLQLPLVLRADARGAHGDRAADVGDRALLAQDRAQARLR